MPANTPQVSAPVSDETRRRFEQASRELGVRKGHLLEQALLHHLQALAELPSDVIIPPRVIVSRESGQTILARLAKPRRPSKAMKALFRDDAED